MKPLSPAACVVLILFSVFVRRAEAQLVVPAGQKPGFVAGNAPLTAGYSGTGSNVDVVYHRMNWRLNPDSSIKAIGGSVTTYFKTTVANVSNITFDLNGVFTVSAKYHGSAITVTRPTTNTINLALPVSLPLGQLDSVVVYYNGTPPPISGAAEGFQLATDATSGQKYIYTLSESYEDRDWWPCKADMQDKIDSIDIIVSTPWNGADTFWVATNGKLIDSAKTGNNRIFKFKNRYPMASYLVCVSVARYNRYYTDITIGGTSVPVVYNLFRGKSTATYNSITTAMNQVNQALIAFSTKFGDYPFKNEKHGFYEGLGGAGGMEHQTFSAIASNALSDISTLTHELMHQWFGDKVSFATWNHLWLAEGFARYSESLVGELVPATGINPVSVRSGNKTKTRSTYSTTTLTIPNSSITNSDGIWNTSYGGAVYDKGAMVVSMLRKLVGDTKFYQALQNYLNDPLLAYKSAVTDDLKRHFEAVTGYDLDPFFNAWVYGMGHANYTIKWNNNGTKRIAIQIASQTKSSGASTGYFYSPVVLKISNATVDTSVVIYDQNTMVSYAGNGIGPTRSGNTLAYTLSFIPTSVVVDPDAETLSVAAATVAKDATINPLLFSPLPLSIIDFKGVKTFSGNQLSLLLATTGEAIKVTVERSEDGAAFTSIGDMVKGTITDNGTVYNLEDKTFSKAHTNFYRAKTVDEDGLVKYSKVVSLKSSAEVATGFSIHPNTVTNTLKLFLSEGWERGPVVVTVFNSTGVAVKQEKQAAAGSMELQVQGLASGTYTVEVSQPYGQAVRQPFVIVR